MSNSFRFGMEGIGEILDKKFCCQCGTLLELTPAGSVCMGCGWRAFTDSGSEIVTEKIYSGISVLDEAKATYIETRPVITDECPACKHNKVFFSSQQMRSADEGETCFFECVKCGFKWRQNN